MHTVRSRRKHTTLPAKAYHAYDIDNINIMDLPSDVISFWRPRNFKLLYLETMKSMCNVGVDSFYTKKPFCNAFTILLHYSMHTASACTWIKLFSHPF